MSQGQSENKTSVLVQQVKDLAQALPRTMRIMEVCGTHTVAIHRHGLAGLVEPKVKLISGPGCPVCVTGTGYIDALIDFARKDKFTIATYGDMVRVPGSRSSLQEARAGGADVRVLLSARDALKMATDNPEKQVVFAAVGFETTTPPTADVILEAKRLGLENFSVLVSHKLVVPAMTALLENGQCRIDGFLCPGHVSVIIGYRAYQVLVERFGRSCVVAGFEPAQILQGLVRLIDSTLEGKAILDNVYAVVVGPDPQARARQLVDQVFEVRDDSWRGIGTIKRSGLRLKQQYRQFDAAERFGVETTGDQQLPQCLCGEVIQGLIDPPGCPMFGRTCTPINPLGPCMVSSEGSCQAWYKYNKDWQGQIRGGK